MPNLTRSIIPGGKLVFHVLGALAEFERDRIRERTQAGLAAARVRGRRGGRPKRLEEEQVKLLRRLYHEKQTLIGTILSTFRISRSTLYRYLRSTSTQLPGV